MEGGLTPLADVALAALGARAASAPPRADLDALLREITDKAAVAYPDIELAEAAFIRHLVSKLPEEAITVAALRDLPAGDLYLAFACAEGIPAALAAFESRILPVVDLALARMNLPADLIDETKQVLRRLLLVGDDTVRPRIADYAGRGELRGWVRVAAAREALRLLRGSEREVPLDRDLLDRGNLPAEDPELRYLKEHYRAEFRAAFRDAIATLSDREKNLLGHQYLDNLTLDEIASLYRVHRATVARWLSRARSQLLRRTHAALRAQLRVSPSELDSILRLIESHLDISLPPLLRLGDD